MPGRALAVVGVLSVLGALAVGRPAAAGAGWQAIGPSGGSARLTIDPSTPTTLYASTGFRVFKTVDGGQTWLPSDAGIGLASFVGEVAVDPVAPSTLYVVSGAGVWRSADGGAAWRRLRGAPTNVSADVIVDSAAHLTLFVGAANQVWKSVDGGVTWAPTGAGLPASASIDCLAIDPLRPALLYAGTDVGLFRSTDGGATWVAARSGISSSEDVLFLTVDPYVEGLLWARVQSANPTLDGIYVSHKGGVSWQRVAALGDDAYCLTVSPAKGHPLYACADGGVLKSTDSGTSWQAVSTGLTAGAFESVVVDAAAPNVLYAGAASTGSPAVFKSENGGALWQSSGAGIYAQTVTALAADPAAAGTVYAGTPSSSVFKTTDGGATWSNANPGLNGVSILELLVDPVTSTTVYAVTNRAFFASTDGGASWARPGARFAAGRLLVADPRASGVLYSTDGALSRTADSGAVWTPLTAAPGFASQLAIAPSDPATLYVTTLVPPLGGFGEFPMSGVYVSHDGGATFAQLPTVFAWAVAVAVDPVDPATVYVSAGTTQEGGSGAVYKSVDGGQTFSILSGVPQLAQLLIDPASPSTIYGATLTTPSDVLVSRDAGATWGELASGLSGAIVGQLAFGPPGTLYAGTQGAGVYQLALDPVP